MRRILNKLSYINQALNRISRIDKSIQTIKQEFRSEIEISKILSAQAIIRLNNSLESVESLSELEFKVFSQWGDDGIIQYLIQKLKIQTKIFIEFGVENYTESNTRFLLLNNNWKGLIIDGSKENVEYIKNDPIYWRHALNVKHAFITVKNINQIILNQGFEGEIGLLSIDIDGNDYYIWEKIDVVQPIIVIIEYNSLFGPCAPYTIPYKDSFVRATQGLEKLFYGASLSSLFDLGKNKGYSFIGCNSAGNNAYFLRDDKLDDSGFPPLEVELGYIESRFREARVNDDWKGGNLNRQFFSDFDIFNTRTGKIQKFGLI